MRGHGGLPSLLLLPDLALPLPEEVVVVAAVRAALMVEERLPDDTGLPCSLAANAGLFSGR